MDERLREAPVRDPDADGQGAGDTRDDAYAQRLARLSGARWKRWLGVQRPYAWNLRRLVREPVLEVGCGIGRNLEALGEASVGVDHNPRAVALARGRGLRAYETAEFEASPHARAGAYATLLFAHVLEHMTPCQASALLGRYLPCLAPGGSVLLIAPQEAGFRADASHVAFLDFAALEALLEGHGLEPERRLSFPFPRPLGRVFPYNEFVVVGRRDAPAS